MINTENSKRIVTAVVLVGVTVAAILFLESFLFAIAVGMVAAAAAWEWCHLVRAVVALGWNIAFIFLIGTAVPVLSVFPTILPWILSIAVFWWVIIAVLIGFRARRAQAPGWQAKKWHVLLVIVPAAVAITAP